MKGPNWGSWLLAVGAALGAALAAVSIVQKPASSSERVPSDAVAVVNGAPILRSDYQRALRALAADRRDGAQAASVRRRALDRLIEQELLVQRGLELELAERDPRIRATLTDAVVGLLVARGETPTEPPTEAELRTYYDQHRAAFRRPGRVRLQQIWLGDQRSGGADPAHARAKEAQRRLAAGEAFGTVQREGDTPAAPLPAGWLTMSKVRDYLGPTATAAIVELDAGAVSAPLRVAGGYTIVRVVARQSARPPDYEQVRDQVAAEVRRSRGDRALRTFLDQRRAAADITIAAERL